MKTTQKMAKVFTISTKYNAKGLMCNLVTTWSETATLDYVLNTLGIKRSEVAEYEVTNSMPLPFALVYSAQKRKALGID